MPHVGQVEIGAVSWHCCHTQGIQWDERWFLDQLQEQEAPGGGHCQARPLACGLPATHVCD